MTWPILIGLLAVALATVFVLYPLLATARRVSESTPDDLAEQRAALYRQVVELEFDFRVGKLSEADYRELSQALLTRASELLALADLADQTLEARLEEEIAAARAALAARQTPAASAER